MTTQAEFVRRRNELIDYFANRTTAGYTNRLGLFEVAAKLQQFRSGGQTAEAVVGECLPILEQSLADPHGDMFWMLPMALVQVLGEGVLPAETLRQMRNQWKTYTPYRGDTENHWLKYYGSLLVMSELFPNDPEQEWFNGRSSRENREESKGYLRHWFRLVLRSGLSEFDSPHYIAMYLAPLALVHGFSSDSEMRKEAGVMLDLLVADFAADSLNGLYVGAFSRVYPIPLLERARNPSTTFSWLLFGNIEFRPDAVNIVLPRTGYRPHAAAVTLAASGYTPSEELHWMATNRQNPYVHRELKRSRRHIRATDSQLSEVYKYTYVCSEFAMGSAATMPAAPGMELPSGAGLVQPIQQHTWELLWPTGDAHDKFNMLFALHPYSDAFEMATYFPEEPRTMTKLVVSQEKPTYDLPEKWTGGSPYEQVMQYRNCLIALYCIPEGTRYPFISTFISGTVEQTLEQDGWVLMKVAGVFVGYYPFAHYVWRDEPNGNRRIHSEHLKNGCIVECVSQNKFETLERFGLSLDVPVVELDPVPRVTYKCNSGEQLVAIYGKVPKLSGTPVDYKNWPVFDGPFVRSARGSNRVDLIGEDGTARTLGLD